MRDERITSPFPGSVLMFGLTVPTDAIPLNWTRLSTEALLPQVPTQPSPPSQTTGTQGFKRARDIQPLGEGSDRRQVEVPTYPLRAFIGQSTRSVKTRLQ